MARSFQPVTVDLGLDEPETEALLRARAAALLGVAEAALPPLVVRRRSLDARRGHARFHVLVDERPPVPPLLGLPEPREVGARRVVIVGDGPAGLFCAYELARHGVGACVVERGRAVQPRRHDVKALLQHGVVPPDSNYCFGEGGAGTFSDGKLYTRADKRGNTRDVLELLVAHGAPEDILIDARPHIGSNRLPQVVTALREHLEQVGVEFRFGARVTGLARELHAEGEGRRVAGVELEGGESIAAEAVVLATGHSARDVWHLLQRAGVSLEAKAFALGLRIEHPQPLINQIQYGKAARHPRLPSASYRLAAEVSGRGVFSFCMCPGGFIVPASTESDALVVNGMSLSRRDSPYANSGLVVSVTPEDAERAARGRTPDASGAFAGVALQARVETAAAEAGGGRLRAPATRLTDFLARRGSTTVPGSSYLPGLTAADVDEAVLAASGLPLAALLRTALAEFGRSLRGFITEEAVLVGVESRTSAPVRVPRDRETLESPDLAGLYPCGEGAGYAGGIASAALDGIRVAQALVRRLGA